ncbi:hypothetical protein (partial), partial [Candidatus Ichthyocystis hellenicum]
MHIAVARNKNTATNVPISTRLLPLYGLIFSGAKDVELIVVVFTIPDSTRVELIIFWIKVDVLMISGAEVVDSIIFLIKVDDSKVDSLITSGAEVVDSIIFWIKVDD